MAINNCSYVCLSMFNSGGKNAERNTKYLLIYKVQLAIELHHYFSYFYTIVRNFMKVKYR